MLWSVAFDRIGVVVSDIYFRDPHVAAGEEGSERGVRLELRAFERDELNGSIYSAVPIRVDRPLWRVDLLETISSAPGSLNRAHHHPRFRGWEPGPRVFVEELSADPVGWLRTRFADVTGVLDDAGVERNELGPTDVADIEAAGPLIVGMVEHLLAEVAAGRAGLQPDAVGSDAENVRASWL